MSSRVIVNVAFGSRYVNGQARLMQSLRTQQRPGEELNARFYTNGYPSNCPTHREVPFAFKAYALEEASRYAKELLWLDSSMVAIAPLDPIWEYAKEHGLWFSKNGFKNSEWTDEKTLLQLFPEALLAKDLALAGQRSYDPLDYLKDLNEEIDHVVGGAFAVNLEHVAGRLFLEEFYRLARETRVFCGDAFGPKGVRHRHDQTAASVIAWRLGVPLTDPPNLFAYRGMEDLSTVVVADGNIL